MRTFASAVGRAAYVGVILGVLIGELVAPGGSPSPADLYIRGLTAWRRSDHDQALRYRSQGVALQPDNALMHYRRAEALAELGHRNCPLDAFRPALLFDPPPAVARVARQHMAALLAPRPAPIETTVLVEPVRGVWLASALLNDTHEARLLVDTGSSVTIVAPALAGSDELQYAPLAGAGEGGEES